VNLAQDFDPGYRAGYVKKKNAKQVMRNGITMLSDYQARLAAQDSHAVLLCLQALDAGGKDGTIRHVMSGVNPQGVHVTSFKRPSAEELDHDYLWRYARHLPARGDIGIFNRSHYEEVLVVRVHPENLDREKLPKDAKGDGVWERLLVIKGELEAQAPKGAPADPFEAKEAKARARKKAKANAEAHGGMKSPSRMATG
jgi:polyphosphate kinase 2 (PPK2 family)